MKNNKPQIVLDTNVLLVSISPLSQFHWIFEELVAGSFDIFISNEILTEYEEIIASRYDKEVVKDLFGVLLSLPNVYKVVPYFRWKLIENDPDDDKFVDCALSANAFGIVTNDKHFNVLKNIDFPKISVYSVDDLQQILKETDTSNN